MTGKPVIAIDGPAASGKGTLARKIAQKLGYAYMDTGALYRAVAHIVLSGEHDPAREDDALAAAKFLNTHFIPETLFDPALRSDAVGNAASKVAAFQSVRKVLINLQRNFAAQALIDHEGAILDGRDIGTVICPDADVKLYITASPEVRAARRLKELQSSGIAATYEAVLTDMRDRDARDSGRATAPLKPAEDALVIDTSDIGADEALDIALSIIEKRINPTR